MICDTPLHSDSHRLPLKSANHSIARPQGGEQAIP